VIKFNMERGLNARGIEIEVGLEFFLSKKRY
jgi:hypothetical protein